MSGIFKGLAIAAVSIGVLAMSAPAADAGKKYRYKSHGGGNFAAGLVTGLIVGGIVSSNRGYRGYGYRCYNAYCNGPYYGNRGYYPKRRYGPSYYGRYYGRLPYYRPGPRYKTTYRRSHYNYCFSKYRSYRAYDNTFQPYHGPRKACRSPYY
ncbi:BA14K family protein [Hoeflea sp. TYP-13]|uniref:BA14K family protein n=1 Tax=Hoeflea sp. TYP-13 TaxID=3230023 RepID=UPI0034C61368